ncbi:unnamed protein product, partial [Ectocarpus sp. 13 AM-2016]
MAAAAAAPTAYRPAGRTTFRQRFVKENSLLVYCLARGRSWCYVARLRCLLPASMASRRHGQGAELQYGHPGVVCANESLHARGRLPRCGCS